MKTVCLDVDDAIFAKAERIADQKKTSISSLMNGYLHDLTCPPDDREAARKRLLELAEGMSGEVGPRTWTRESLYER